MSLRSLFSFGFLVTPKSILHVRIKLLLPVCCSVAFPLEGAHAAEATRQAALVGGALAELLQNARFLHLLFKALLQTVVALVAVLVSVDCHSRGRLLEQRGRCKPNLVRK